MLHAASDTFPYGDCDLSVIDDSIGSFVDPKNKSENDQWPHGNKSTSVPFPLPQGKYYSTKYAPPKKESKESKQLSDNIQKFLKKREAEESQRKQQEREKLNNLLAMRDEKSKNKIRKMLKVTKSANKSVLEDAKDCDNTAVSLGGPDGDDYGYVSNEANAFYQKYLEKVKDVQEDKGFAPSRPQSLRDLSGTKERVKAAITREREEAKSHTRQRISHAAAGGTGSGSGSHRTTSSSKPLYDPEAEERKKREEENLQKAKAKAKRPPQPPPMDFQALLRLAEKKQHEPVTIAAPERKKEPERLFSAREKREQEERQRWKEQRAQRDRMREMEASKPKEQQRKESSSSGAATSRMEPNGRIPKLNKTSTTTPTPTSTAKSNSTSDSLKRPAAATTAPSAKLSASTKPTTNGSSSSSSKRPLGSSSAAASSSSTKPTASSSAKPAAAAAAAPQSRNPYAAAIKAGVTREFPPREFPPRDIAKTRTMPQLDVQRRRQQAEARAGRAGPPPGGAARPRQPEKSECDEQFKGNLGSFKSFPFAGRIYDDDDSEYDSELDDFIDDGGCEEDISSHIRDIFGYDKRRYRDMDDDDDRMESSYAQVQREEFISKKLGELLLPLFLSRSSLTCSDLVQVYKRIWRTCA